MEAFDEVQRYKRAFGSESETFWSESWLQASNSMGFAAPSIKIGGFRGSRHTRHKHRLLLRLPALKSVDFEGPGDEMAMRRR